MRPDRAGNTAVDALRRDWQRWTAIVELFARRRPARRRVAPREYAELYEELLTLCHDLTDSGVTNDRLCYGSLESLVRPWLNPRVLEHADREILFDLLLQCRELGRPLGCRAPWRMELPAWLLPALLLGIAAVGVLSLLAAVGDAAPALLDPSVRMLNRIERTIRRASDLQQWFATALVLVVASILVVSRSIRA